MGGAERLQGVRTLTMKGGVGTRHRLGQTVKVSDPETAATLKNVTETLDRTNNRAALDYELQLGPFGQHRREILTKKNDRPVGLEDVAGRPLAVMSPSGLFSWGTQNSARVPPQAECDRGRSGRVDVGDGGSIQDKSFDGRMFKAGVREAAVRRADHGLLRS